MKPEGREEWQDVHMDFCSLLGMERHFLLEKGIAKG
jgi:hypothetical protein